MKKGVSQKSIFRLRDTPFFCETLYTGRADVEVYSCRKKWKHISASSAKICFILFDSKNLSGESGIRTHARLTTPNAFRVRPLMTTWVSLHIWFIRNITYYSKIQSKMQVRFLCMPLDLRGSLGQTKNSTHDWYPIRRKVRKIYET